MIDRDLDIAIAAEEQKALAAKIKKTGDENAVLNAAEKKAALLRAQLNVAQTEVDVMSNQEKVHRKMAEKEQKQEETEEEKTIGNWNAFVTAKEMLDKTNMNFFRDGQAKYFMKLTTKTANPKTGVEEYETDVKYYPPSSLKDNWLEFKDERVLYWFRRIIEGGEITVKDPSTGQFETYSFPSRLYEKLTNTTRKVDSNVFNLLDIDGRLIPNYSHEEVQECPPILKALMFSCSGNEMIWDENTNQWIGDKMENLHWYEKWIYGTVYADIGNAMASMPITFGSGKVGQNALYDIVFSAILGRQACMSTIWDVIHGNFDGFKLGKVFVFIDEVPERDDWNRLKNMTGSPQAFVRQKYGAEFSIDNIIRYALSSNAENYPGPVENGRQMERYSPIKKNPNSTFAENTIKILDKINGDGYCRKMLKEFNSALNVDTMSNFAVGDTLLRTALAGQWQTREAAQLFLNYLDQTYKSDNGSYSNPPLRGKDWEDIVMAKGSITDKIVHYCKEINVDTITINELYEIYKVLQSERNDSVKKINGLSQTIKQPLIDAGWSCYQNVHVGGGVRTTVYSRTTNDFSDYVEDVDKYISVINLSNEVFNKSTVRRLKVGNSTLEYMLKKNGSKSGIF